MARHLVMKGIAVTLWHAVYKSLRQIRLNVTRWHVTGVHRSESVVKLVKAARSLGGICGSKLPFRSDTASRLGTKVALHLPGLHCCCCCRCVALAGGPFLVAETMTQLGVHEAAISNAS